MSEKQTEAQRLADRLISPKAGPWDNYDASEMLRKQDELLRQACGVFETIDAWLKQRSGGTGLMPQEIAVLDSIRNHLEVK